MKINFNDMDELSRDWFSFFVEVHYPLVSIEEDKNGTFLNIEEILFDYILAMKDEEIEQYLD